MTGRGKKQKGGRRERQCRDIFISMGYDVVKAGGSLGMFDLVAVPTGEHSSVTRTIMIQVKSNYMPPREVYEIAQHETLAVKQIWVKPDRKPWLHCTIEDGV